MTDSRDRVDKARNHIASGRYLLAGDFIEQAGRDAYLAASDAAPVFITSRTGKRPKTHRGTRTEFARLAKDEPRIDQRYVAFLANGYEVETLADYEDGVSITRLEALAALGTATQFVDLIAELLRGEDR